MRHFIVATVAAVGLVAATSNARAAHPWRLWEHSWTAAAEPRNAQDVELRVTLTSPSGKTWAVTGFWDGGAIWKLRFVPDEVGPWTFAAKTTPAVAGVDGAKGTFQCVPSAKRGRFETHGPIRVAAAKTYLEHADGTPFFWLADTVWNGPLLATENDWAAFLADRAAKKFTVIQTNALAPWRTAPTDEAGQTAYTGANPIRINPAFFQRLDGRVDAIAAAGMLYAPVLAWANTKGDPGVDLDEADLKRLICYQIARYGAHPVVWILAGDNRYDQASTQRWQRIGREVFGSAKAHAPVATHPTGMNWPWEAWR